MLHKSLDVLRRMIAFAFYLFGIALPFAIGRFFSKKGKGCADIRSIPRGDVVHRVGVSSYREQRATLPNLYRSGGLGSAYFFVISSLIAYVAPRKQDAAIEPAELPHFQYTLH